MPRPSRDFPAGIIPIILVVVLLDQLTKWLSQVFLAQQPLVLTSYLSLISVKNSGAAFSLFKDANLSLIFVSLVFIGFLLLSFEQFTRERVQKVFYAMLLGGAFGNLLDRIFRGGVVDFLDLSFWPTFNVADSALSVGIIGLLVMTIIDERKDKANKKRRR